MLVRELMSRRFISVRPTETVGAARNLLRANETHHLLVVDTDVVGVVDMRDLAGSPDTTPVQQVMHRGVATIDADSTLRKAASLMIRGTTGCLPVTENGRITGVITTNDLMRVLNADATLS